LEASARMAEVSTPSRFTLVDTFRHGILARFLSASASGWPPSPPSALLRSLLSVVSATPLPRYPPTRKTNGISSPLPSRLIIGCLGWACLVSSSLWALV
jgi:hypothetical protein